ncbi:MAG: hypothetical protein ABI995_11780, partial [Acidobacteriota bacterium]
MMLRWALCLIFAAGLSAPLLAANIRLYLKDGDYQIVREYQVQQDRVRFYSVDRRDWEEIPLELVDIKKTEAESAEKAAATAVVVEQEKVEDEAIKADRRLAASIPDAPGAYWIDGSSLLPLIAIEVTAENSKARRILQVLSPAPIIAGKTTVTVAGKAAKFRVTNSTPEFFFRLAQEERFGIIKLEAKKNDRLVETAEVLPNGEGTMEQQKTVP